ncbi:GIY-YIG nuclease family protein [Winogradskyella maritima]|uniref:GIY-YIG nuclease family protein n=1 Tax=Winogradskyella maritima TaxID=1517766 RepID=A0ABV8AC35_9FLAO|nr:GIY-YIG nuclease family protein [Winogradskyella maritima]
MAYYTYIIYSRSRDLYYKGSTSNFPKRLKYHNSEKNKDFTSSGRPWIEVLVIEKLSKNEAYLLEMKLKNLNRQRLEAFIKKYSPK